MEILGFKQLCRAFWYTAEPVVHWDIQENIHLLWEAINDLRTSTQFRRAFEEAVSDM